MAKHHTNWLWNPLAKILYPTNKKTTINDSANAFMQTAMKTYVKKYSIVRTEIKKDKSIVLTVKVKGFDVTDFQNIDTNAIENSVAPKYEEQLNQVTSQEQAYDV